MKTKENCSPDRVTYCKLKNISDKVIEVKLKSKEKVIFSPGEEKDFFHNKLLIETVNKKIYSISEKLEILKI
jgi:hypothetical protein